MCVRMYCAMTACEYCRSSAACIAAVACALSAKGHEGPLQREAARVWLAWTRTVNTWHGGRGAPRVAGRKLREQRIVSFAGVATTRVVLAARRPSCKGSMASLLTESHVRSNPGSVRAWSRANLAWDQRQNPASVAMKARPCV